MTNEITLLGHESGITKEKSRMKFRRVLVRVRDICNDICKLLAKRFTVGYDREGQEATEFKTLLAFSHETLSWLAFGISKIFMNFILLQEDEKKEENSLVHK